MAPTSSCSPFLLSATSALCAQPMRVFLQLMWQHCRLAASVVAELCLAPIRFTVRTYALYLRESFACSPPLQHTNTLTKLPKSPSPRSSKKYPNRNKYQNATSTPVHSNLHPLAAVSISPALTFRASTMSWHHGSFELQCAMESYS